MASDYVIARAQFVKTKRTEVRLRYALIADAELARLLPEWRAEFDTKFRETAPQVLDLHSELRRLGAGPRA
jgi:hypothetical protein